MNIFSRLFINTINHLSFIFIEKKKKQKWILDLINFYVISESDQWKNAGSEKTEKSIGLSIVKRYFFSVHRITSEIIYTY